MTTKPTMALTDLSEKGALAAVVQEAYVHWVSTRSVDERVHAFLDRPDRPIEGVGRSFGSTRPTCRYGEAGRIVSVAAIVAVGVSSEGMREVLDMAIRPSEAEPFWSGFLRSLMGRGLRG